MVKQIAARLRERSTWAGIAALLSIAGVNIAPEAWNVAVDLGVALAAAAAILFPEHGQ
jgi:hypothetical protein